MACYYYYLPCVSRFYHCHHHFVRVLFGQQLHIVGVHLLIEITARLVGTNHRIFRSSNPSLAYKSATCLCCCTSYHFQQHRYQHHCQETISLTFFPIFGFCFRSSASNSFSVAGFMERRLFALSLLLSDLICRGFTSFILGFFDVL